MVMEAKLTFAAVALIAATSAMGQAQWQVTKITEASGRENWACEPSVAVDPKGSSVYLGNVLNQLHRNKRSNFRHRLCCSIWIDHRKRCNSDHERRPYRSYHF